MGEKMNMYDSDVDRIKNNPYTSEAHADVVKRSLYDSNHPLHELAKTVLKMYDEDHRNNNGDRTMQPGIPGERFKQLEPDQLHIYKAWNKVASWDGNSIKQYYEKLDDLEKPKS